MEWGNNRESDNVEDARDSSGGSSGGGFGGGGGGLIGGLLSGRMGIGTIVIALAASYFLGINPLTVLGFLDGGPTPQVQQHAGQTHSVPAGDVLARHVSEVLGTTEEVWASQFKAAGSQYRAPKLVLFRGSYPTACGQGQSAQGPFYCPADQKVYIDLAFYETLKNRLGAPGEFAQAYVIAHEVGHHVQNLLGISGKVDAQRGRISEAQQNVLSVRLELQADCLAGVWGYHVKDKLRIDQSDVDSAMNAATKIGDDALQRQATGTIRPESFTHGSSAQRVRWFTTGLQSGSIQRCDTFNVRDL